MTNGEDIPSLTLQVLPDIRQETRGPRTDLGERLDETNQRLDPECVTVVVAPT